MAAVLACGEGAVLSHRSAAMLWRMLEPRRSVPHVTVKNRNGRASRKGLRLHRSSTLPTSETTHQLNIPVTKPARTLDDLRRAGPASEYRRALRQAEFRRLPVGDAPGTAPAATWRPASSPSAAATTCPSPKSTPRSAPTRSTSSGEPSES
jgi:hypothetical protein